MCHKLALSCTDTNESLKYIKEVETWLKQLWYFFEKKMAKYLKTQIALKVNFNQKHCQKCCLKVEKSMQDQMAESGGISQSCISRL